MHWSDKLLLCSTDYISVNASLFYLFLPTHITIDDTQVQGCYQLKLIPSQLFFTPSFFHPFLPPFFHPSFFSRFRAMPLCSQLFQMCIEHLVMLLLLWALGVHK